MEFINEAELIEAVLWLEKGLVSNEQLAKITTLPLHVVDQALLSLKALLEQKGGLELIQEAEGYTLAPKKLLWPYLKDRYGKFKSDKLSKSELEALAIIAYSQPVSRSEIEAIRGVNSEGSIKRLLNRQLVKELGKLDAPGKPIIYGTTADFLTLFGMKSIAELPKMDDQDFDKFELK